MKDRVELLQEALRIDTSSGGEIALAEMLARWLTEHGIDARMEAVPGNRSNLVAQLPGKSSQRKLMFNAHMDTVPTGEGWTKDPFGGEVADGRVYGRGASDTKSSLVAMAVAMVELSQETVPLPCDVVLLGTAGEETDFGGAKAFAATGGMEDISCLVIGEPTNQRGQSRCLDVVNATKGHFVGVLRTKGVSSHGASPEAGVNAVLRMSEFLEWLRLHPPYAGFRPDPSLGAPTWAPTMVRGGEAENLIPDRCEVTLDLRPIPGMTEDEALRPFREAAQTLWGTGWPERVEISGRDFLAPLLCEATHPAIGTALGVAQECGITAKARSFFGACDASFLRVNPNMPFFIFGPGLENQAHKPDEYVQVEDYLAAILFYTKFAHRLSL